MKKKLFLIFILSLTVNLLAREIEVTPETGIFDSPDVYKSRILFINKTVKMEYLEKKYILPHKVSLFRPLEIYRVKYKIGSIWVAPDVKVSRENGKTKVSYKRNPLFLYISAVCAIIFVLLLYFYFSRLRKKTLKYDIRCYIFPALLVLVHFTILFYFLYLARGQLRYPMDEFAFFKTAKGIMNWNFDYKWDMTVGMPLVYIPFILIFQAKNMFDIVLPVCIFFGCVLMPASIVFVFFIARKLNSSFRYGFFAALLWMILNVVYFPLELEVEPSISVFSWFGTDIGEYISTCYLFIRTGFNSMSGNLSMFTLFAAIFLVLYMNPRLKTFAIISAIYGFSCITRINNVFFAPLIAWLLWCSGKELFSDRKYMLKAFAVSLSAFMAVFSLQLAANYLNFSSITVFPYVLHNTEVYNGFEVKNLSRGINYYFSIHYFFFAAGLAAIASIKERNLRVSLILWAIPLTLFFCGYCILGQPIRFLLPVFSSLCIAIVYPWFNNDLSRREKILLFITVILLAIPILPFAFEQVLAPMYSNPLSIFSHFRFLAGLPLWIYVLYKLRKQLFTFVFLILYGIFIFTGSNYILFGACVLALIYALLAFILDIFRTFPRISANE